jgi:hypothetical protein
MIAGGLSGEHSGDQSVEQDILNEVRNEAERSIGKSFSTFKLIKFATQVVAGTIYVMKVQCNEEFYHIKIIKPLPHTNLPPSIMKIKGNESLDSKLQL